MSGHGHDVLCPDPSVHEKSNKLSEQASTAALYVTHPERATETRVPQENPLGPDGKLSSKSAAASLKYAKPQDLPSFPSNGLTADNAGKAAMLAKDYKMKDLWQPEQRLAGSKAAILAQQKGGKLDLWQASATSDGHSAATLAMRNKGLSPAAYAGVDSDNRNKALLAATMSANKSRSRADSTPAPPPPQYPDAQNSSQNALNAATVSHRTSTFKSSTADGWDSDAMQAARIKNSHMEREMFSSAPPVDIERDEARHQAALRASAVSMAKQIYESQDRNVMVADPADIAGAQAAAGRSSTSSAGPTDLKTEAMKYISLQETAHKLAAERLAKVDKNLEDSRYREYYGYGDNKSKRLSQRMSMRSVGGRQQRKRASSDATSSRYEEDSDDEEQARRIRSQMSQLHSGLTQVDQKKQQDDRARLMAAAEKRVSQRMHNMDEKVFADTGKVPPALMEQWEAKARERALKERELQAQHPGKTHIGGGKFMDQAEIEAIAAARLKPTLDDINDTAQKKRDRDEELRLEKEEQERVKREEKATKKEEKDEQKRIKNEEKAVHKHQKEEEKARKDEEKARKAEEKRLAKEEQRKSREVKREEAQDAAAAGAGGAALAEVAEKVRDDNEPADEGTTAEGVQRHRSAISRLKDRFRKSHDEPAHEQEKKSHNGAAVAGGAATGATLAEVDDEQLSSQQAAHAVTSNKTNKEAAVSPASTGAAQETAAPVDMSSAVAEPVTTTEDKAKTVAAPAVVAPAIVVDEGDDYEVGAKQTRPEFAQQPSLSGFHNDAVPQARPDLERHISRIPDSDGDSDEDEEDWNDERSERPAVAAMGSNNAHTIADRVVSAPTTDKIASAPATDTVTAAPVAERTEDAPRPIYGDMDKALAQLDDQRAEPPKDLPATLEASGASKATAVEQEPNVAESATNAAPAAILTDDKLQTEPGHKEHNILRQIINPGGDKYDDEAFGETAQAVPPTEAKEEKPEGHTKYDTKAFPAPTEAKEEKPTTSSTAAVPATAAATEKTEHAKLTKNKSPSSQESEKERKGGLRGLLNKLGGRKSKAETSDSGSSVPYEDHKAANKPTTTAAAKEPSTVLPPVETGPKFGDEHAGKGKESTELESPSSFRRNDISSDDEDEVPRGRGGRNTTAGKLGFGGSRTYKNDAAQRQGSEDETFEEARDHFDENLAPPPAFAGQAKSESPVRETRFQEQL